MRGIFRRGSRLELVAGLGIALAMPALTVAAASAQGVSTTTTLAATTTQAGEVSPPATCTLTNLAVVVTGNAGVPAGTVNIEDGVGTGALQLASAALDATGQAAFVLDLPDGPHSLTAVYAGNTAFQNSASTASSVTISSQCDSTFVVAAYNPTQPPTTLTTLSLTAGQAGTVAVAVAPSQAYLASLTAPAFITLSCSGLPDQAGCTVTPENVEISPGQLAGATSTMVFQTYAASTSSISPAPRPGKNSNRIAWAFLLPGALGLGGLAWGARRRRWLTRLSLVALVGLVILMGTTGCNPRYGYENRGPVPNPPTPAGTYTIKVTAQSSNGVTATTQSSSFVLIVK